jgi:hypothetical protein
MHWLIVLLALCSSSIGAFAQVSQDLSLTTNGCKNQDRLEQPVCLPPGQEIDQQPIFVTQSIAGGSSFVWTFDPNLKNCIRVTLIAVPLGEDCINLGFSRPCNCRGRGWIKVRVTLRPKP